MHVPKERTSPKKQRNCTPDPPHHRESGSAGCVPENPLWLWAGYSTAPLPPTALELFPFVRVTGLATHIAAPR